MTGGTPINVEPSIWVMILIHVHGIFPEISHPFWVPPWIGPPPLPHHQHRSKQHTPKANSMARATRARSLMDFSMRRRPKNSSAGYKWDDSYIVYTNNRDVFRRMSWNRLKYVEIVYLCISIYIYIFKALYLTIYDICIYIYNVLVYIYIHISDWVHTDNVDGAVYHQNLWIPWSLPMVNLKHLTETVEA